MCFVGDNSVDLITSFVTFHHIDDTDGVLRELSRILRPGGYLIIREHDCENSESVSKTYLNFVHAIMMIAGVGEFSSSAIENGSRKWEDEKNEIMSYVKTIHYRSCAQWEKELGRVGFVSLATLWYGQDGSSNPQKLFYAVYQLQKH